MEEKVVFKDKDESWKLLKKKQEKVSRHMRYAELFSLMKVQVICV